MTSRSSHTSGLKAKILNGFTLVVIIELGVTKSLNARPVTIFYSNFKV